MQLNVVVANDYVVGDESRLFFSGEPVELVPPTTDMYDLLVRVGLFPSKGQARKNWQRTGPEIPWGFSDFVFKKGRRITILRPTIDNVLDARIAGEENEE